MNEAETRAELVDPALKAAGWGVVEGSRIRREYHITKGRLQGAGKRAKPTIADYVLVYKNQALAIVEAKPRDAKVSEGVAQAKEYATKMSLGFTYATNGLGIYQINMETGEEGDIAIYPSPEELWELIFKEQNVWRERFAIVPLEEKSGTWKPRYYQEIAINRTLEAIAHGKQRILLTLATGTGKTFIAFQLAWKLFHSRWNLTRDAERRPRILFLADRNILADQAYTSFSPFPEDALVRIDPNEIRKKGIVPKNGSLFFTIFQTFLSGTKEQENLTEHFWQYPPDFFDFIIIDECHRGGANDESSWRGILEYFSPAVQLGLTATPKRQGNVDTYHYFGEPIYTYSLKEGINDGFLTPFKVRQIATTLDDYVYTEDDDLIEGEVEIGKRYKEEDFNRIIEIKEREAYRVKLLMSEIHPNEKTIVFCATQDHALVVRDLINQMKLSKSPNYCVRVTANDGELGEQYLRDFQDNEKTIPTILTTSRKLSTGVDARNVRNIVLMRPVKSMIEFKQIIGRGTRLYDNKDYFTIYDFVKAYEHFEDAAWDGEPLDPATGKKKVNDEQDELVVRETLEDAEKFKPPKKIKIKLRDGKERTIQHMTSTSFWDADGKPISAAQFLENLFGVLPGLFKNEDELREIWSEPDTRKSLLTKLSEKGFGQEQLREISLLIDAENCDLYDVLSYIAFVAQPKTRVLRAKSCHDYIGGHFENKQQAFIDFVLDQYVKEGVAELDQDKLPELMKLKYGSIDDAVEALGAAHHIKDTFVSFQRYLYQQSG